jgi:uncharacterized protein (TIGR03083 family)
VWKLDRQLRRQNERDQLSAQMQGGVALDVWAMTAAERTNLVDRLAPLEDEQWAAPSLCTPWTVRDVTGHILAIASMSTGRFFGGLAGNGFSFDRLQEHGIKRETEGKTNAELVAALREKIDSHAKPPGPATTVLGETLVHGEDIFRALDGTFLPHPDEHIATCAEFYKRNVFPLKVKRRIAGVTLRMTDIDWSYGSGPEISGPGIAILMAMVGRKAVLGDLQGDGVAILAGRR